METFNIVVSLGVILLFIATVIVLVGQKNSVVKQTILNKGLELAFIVAFFTTFGSLAYSTLWSLPPCPLCWYQRIFMFPLPILLLVALVNKDRRVWQYITPLALIGLFISAYQSLLQTGLFGQSLFCEPGSIESCSIPEIQVFGFVTIPLMAFVSFFAISTISLLSQYKIK